MVSKSHLQQQRQGMSESISRHGLDAVEAAVLLHLNGHAGSKAIRAALGQLGMVGAIRRADARPSRWGRQVRLVVHALSAERVGAMHPGTAAVYEALRSRGKESHTYAPTEVLARLQKVFGISYRVLLDKRVFPVLAQRGLVESITRRRLRFFSSTRLEPTAAGSLVLAELKALKADAESIAPLVKRDPQAAALKCMHMGTALLLADNLRPQMKKLSAVAGASLAGGEVARLVDEANGERRSGWLDGMDVFSTMDWATALDALDGAFDAADAGSADGGSDGGGDGGGD